MERHVCGSSNPVPEVRETSCGALDLDLEAEKEVARESHLARPPTGKPVSTGSDAAAARSLTSAGLCVSFHCHQSMNEKSSYHRGKPNATARGLESISDGEGFLRERAGSYSGLE